MNTSINNVEVRPSDAIPPISRIDKHPRLDNKKKRDFRETLDHYLQKQQKKEKVAMLKISDRDDELENENEEKEELTVDEKELNRDLGSTEILDAADLDEVSQLTHELKMQKRLQMIKDRHIAWMKKNRPEEYESWLKENHPDVWEVEFGVGKSEEEVAEESPELIVEESEEEESEEFEDEDEEDETSEKSEKEDEEAFEVSEVDEDEDEEGEESSSSKRQKGYKFDEAFERRDSIMPEIEDLALFAYIPDDAMTLGYDIDDFVEKLDESDDLGRIRSKAKKELNLSDASDADKGKISDFVKEIYGNEKASEKDRLLKQIEDLNELEAAFIESYLDDKASTLRRKRKKDEEKKQIEKENLEPEEDEDE